jgi:outer membrane receptor protein involved in Fe transport
MRYEKRENFEEHFITDSQISREIKYVTFTIKASNLFNKSYMDLGSIPLPGRWISANIKFSWE